MNNLIHNIYTHELPNVQLVYCKLMNICHKWCHNMAHQVHTLTVNYCALGVYNSELVDSKNNTLSLFVSKFQIAIDLSDLSLLAEQWFLNFPNMTKEV